MATNWKNRAEKLEQDLAALRTRAKDVGFAFVKEKDACRKATQDYMNAQQKLMRAITAIESGVEILTAHRLFASASTFRMVANDLAPQRGATEATGTREEQH